MIRLPHCGKELVQPRHRGHILRSRSAFSKQPRSKSQPPTRCSPTAERSNRSNAISRLISNTGKDVALRGDAPRTIARADTTFLVTNMMRSVLNEGTGAALGLRASRRMRRESQERPTIS
jgi:hypothetical protein